MPDNREVRQPGQSTNQAQSAQQESARQIQEQLEQELHAVADNELQKRRLAKNLTDAVKDADVSAGEQRRSTHLRSQGTPHEVSENERQQLRKDLVRVLKAVEQGVIEAPSEANKAVLLHLNEFIGRQLNENNSAFIQPLVAKLLESNQTAEDLQAQFETLKAEFGVFSPDLVRKVSEAMVQSADDGKLAVDGERAREMFADDTENQPDMRGDSGEAVSREMWQTYYQSFFGDDPEDRKVINALYSADKLKDFVSERKERVGRDFQQTNNRHPSDEELWRLTSEDVEREIVLRFSKLYLRVDKQRPNEPFEQIASQGGLYDSIQIVQIQMLRALEQLGEKISRMSGDEYQTSFGEMKFFRRFSKQELDEKVVQVKEIKDKNGNVIEKAGTKTVRQYKIQPVAGAKQVESIQEFLDDVHTMVEHEVATRAYLHNVKLAFMRPAGEGGFWGGLARYAEQMPSTDIDSMMHLPDSHLFMSAYRLYVKYLEEEFAVIDWKHQPNMFSPDFFNNRTAIEQRVRVDLKRLFPDELKNEMNWRLDRAMSMGIGLAKGVLLTEAEIAAWAEPHLNMENGKATFTSMYTNDGVATATLNPQHHFLRWQTEGAKKGPLIFLPLIGMGGKIDKSFMRGHWDHRVMWEMAQKFRDSYMSGKGAFKDGKGGRPEGEKLFIDFMPNFAKVGGYFTRGGWRADHEIAGSLHYKVDAQTHAKTLDVMRSWKALENIGYEALVPLTRVGGFKLSTELRQYLFTKYISGTGASGMNEEAYFKGLNAKSETERNEFFIQHVFANLLIQRMPTKLIRIERDRQSDNGIRAWEKVRASIPGCTADQMNSRMQNLMMVESKVRIDTSRKMNEYLQRHGGEQDLSQLSINDYRVDEERIRKVLTAAQVDAAEINATVVLFQKIQEYTFSGVMGKRYVDEFATKLKNKEFPFSIGVEEVDPSFLALRAAGQRVLARALGDTGQVESNVYGTMTKYIESLQPISLDPKHDTSELVKMLHTMHHTIEGIHGHEQAAKIVTAMASMTIAYFKKDSIAKNLFTQIGTVSRKNSLAAEFAGTFRGVWEWDNGDVDNFIFQLERMKLLPKEALDLGDESLVTIENKKLLGIIPYKRTVRAMELNSDGNPVMEDKKFLGLIPYKSAVRKEQHHYLSGQDLRKNFGATKADLAMEIVNRWVPLALAAIMYTLMTKAFKENEKK